MWCIGRLTEEYRDRMYDLLRLYEKDYCPEEPVVCIDEKSKQLLRDSRQPLAPKPGLPMRQDYEYVRAGTCNLFVAVEPKGGQRTVEITERRTKTDFVAFVCHLAERVYAGARCIHLVLDNLNTHVRESFAEVMGADSARELLRRVKFHYTPKHASWLNMAEIEIGILDRQCLDRRFPSRVVLTSEVAAWQKRRNTERRCIQWTFSIQDADRKLARHYIS